VATVKELQQQILDLNVANALEKAVTDRLASEVNDLKDGLAMVEEKARSELGMVKPNEIFVQIVRR
jgi:cell division protein FtsB